MADTQGPENAAKKKKGLIAAAVLLAAAALCLWYTRPVSTERVMDGMPVEYLTGILQTVYVENGIGGFDIWKLDDALDADTPECREMMDILSRATYRTHLRNLLGRWYSDRSSYEWDGSTYAFLMFTDGQDRSITFNLDQKTLRVNRSWEDRSYLYTLRDPQTLSDIAALFQKYGTFQDE